MFFPHDLYHYCVLINRTDFDMKKKLCHSLLTICLTTNAMNLSANENNAQSDIVKATKIQEIRNATIKVMYEDTVFLIDPMFAGKGFYDGFENTHRSYLRNPLVDLPMKPGVILEDVDAVIVTHTHLDHWDDAAQASISKNMPVFVQNEQDQKIIQSQGFKDVRVLTTTNFGGVRITKTDGQHGTDAMYDIPEVKMRLGEAMGIVFEKEGHAVTYVAGDTIWRSEVDQTIEKFKPNIIVLNTGNALIDGFDESIIMGKEDAYRAVQKAPNAKVVAVHMDAINHMSLTRDELSKYVKDKKIEDKVFIPLDGEIISF